MKTAFTFCCTNPMRRTERLSSGHDAHRNGSAATTLIGRETRSFYIPETAGEKRAITMRSGFSLELTALSRAMDRALRARAGGLALTAAAGAGLVLAPVPVLAATFTVDSTADASDAAIDGTCATAAGACTLRAAIEEANANDNGPATVDEVLFDSTVTGTIILGGTEIFITDELTITGPGAGTLTVDADDQSRVLNASSATSLTSLSGLTLANGYGTGSGGAIHAYNDLALDQVTVRDSVAQGGGGFLVESGDAALTHSTVSGNTAVYTGGGFRVESGDVTLTHSTVSGNTAGYDGGGFLVFPGNATLTNSTVSGNTADFLGGGFFLSGGNAMLTNSTVSGNTADYGGGGFYVLSGDASLTHSTVSGNTTDEGGGGFFVTSGYAMLAHSTVSNNTADVGGGFGLFNVNATLTNSVVADNTAPNFPAFDVQGMLTANYSLVEGSSTGIDSGSGNLTGQDPGLGHLQDNGGPTETHALDFNSPAFNAGDPDFSTPPDFDQRGTGFPRVAFSRLDMGAFEFQGPIPVSLSIAPDPANLAEAGGSATIAACLPAGVSAGEDVDVTVSVSGTATPDTDHDFSDGTVVTIATGNDCGDGTLAATDDTLDEPDETVIVDIDSLPLGYTEGTPNQASATIVDDDFPVVALSLSGSPFAENGGVAQVTATLDQPGQLPVTVDLGLAGSASQGTDYTAPATQIMIPAGMTLGSVDLTGVDDDIDENNETVIADIAGLTNATAGTPDQVTATILDDDTAGFGVVAPAGGLTTTEADGTDTFTVVLGTIPAADVTIALDSSDPGEALPSPTSLTFTPANWDSPRTVTVSGVDDMTIDGDIAFNIITAPAISADPVYDGLDPADVPGINGDDDAPAIPVPALGPLGLILLPLLIPLAAWRCLRKRRA